MQVSSFVEILEPRWAPARLLSGPLPLQFGVDLASLSVSLIDAGIDGAAAASDGLAYSARLPDGPELGLQARASVHTWDPATFSISSSLLRRIDLSIDRGETRPLDLEARAFSDSMRFGRR